MKNKLIVPITVAILGVLCAGMSFLSFSSMNKGSSSNWMKDLDDDTPITRISMPGSHNSGALYSLADLTGKCQDADIASQLSFGVRFLDLRLRLNGDDLEVCHSLIDERLSFDQVNKTIADFLKENPKEALVVSLVKEIKEDDTATFDAILSKKVAEAGFYFTENSLPTLGEVRGKAYVLSRYPNPSIGAPLDEEWKDSTTFNIAANEITYHIQDNYRLDSVDAKWNDFVDCLDYAEIATEDVMTINYASGYLKDAFPMMYSVPVAKEMNPRIKEKVGEYSHTGIIAMDFVSEELCKAIYGRNFQ